MSCPLLTLCIPSGECRACSQIPRIRGGRPHARRANGRLFIQATDRDDATHARSLRRRFDAHVAAYRCVTCCGFQVGHVRPRGEEIR